MTQAAGDLFFWLPRHETPGTSYVLVVARLAVLHALLVEGGAGDLGEEHRHGDRADHGGQAGPRGSHHDPDAGPDAGVAEVVGVAGVAPESLIHQLALVGRLRLEARELGVAD